MQWRVGLLSMVVLGAVAWCLLSPSQALPRPTEPDDFVASAPAQAPTTMPAPETTTTPDNSPAQELPSQPAASPEETRIGMQSHPVTPEHLRIYRENNLIGDLNGAMDVADVAGLRRLIKQYREEFPEDSHVLRDGYELIADCLERPGPETSARAQRYYDEELASGLRRYIRRHCLEAPNR